MIFQVCVSFHVSTPGCGKGPAEGLVPSRGSQWVQTLSSVSNVEPKRKKETQTPCVKRETGSWGKHVSANRDSLSCSELRPWH